MALIWVVSVALLFAVFASRNEPGAVTVAVLLSVPVAVPLTVPLTVKVAVPPDRRLTLTPLMLPAPLLTLPLEPAE